MSDKQTLERDLADIDRRRAELEAVLGTVSPSCFDYRDVSWLDCGPCAARLLNSKRLLSLAGLDLGGRACPAMKQRSC